MVRRCGGLELVLGVQRPGPVVRAAVIGVPDLANFT